MCLFICIDQHWALIHDVFYYTLKGPGETGPRGKREPGQRGTPPGGQSPFPGGRGCPGPAGPRGTPGVPQREPEPGCGPSESR